MFLDCEGIDTKSQPPGRDGQARADRPHTLTVESEFDATPRRCCTRVFCQERCRASVLLSELVNAGKGLTGSRFVSAVEKTRRLGTSNSCCRWLIRAQVGEGWSVLLALESVGFAVWVAPAIHLEGHDFAMTMLGIVLPVLGFFLALPLLWSIGVVLLVIGLELMVLGKLGHAIGVRRYIFSLGLGRAGSGASNLEKAKPTAMPIRQRKSAPTRERGRRLIDLAARAPARSTSASTSVPRARPTSTRHPTRSPPAAVPSGVGHLPRHGERDTATRTDATIRPVGLSPPLLSSGVVMEAAW